MMALGAALAAEPCLSVSEIPPSRDFPGVSVVRTLLPPQGLRFNP